MQESKSIIEVNGVSKFFGEKTALDHVTLNVKKGEFVTILGLRDVARLLCCALSPASRQLRKAR